MKMAKQLAILASSAAFLAACGNGPDFETPPENDGQVRVLESTGSRFSVYEGDGYTGEYAVFSDASFAATSFMQSLQSAGITIEGRAHEFDAEQPDYLQPEGGISLSVRNESSEDNAAFNTRLNLSFDDGVVFRGYNGYGEEINNYSVSPETAYVARAMAINSATIGGLVPGGWGFINGSTSNVIGGFNLDQSFARIAYPEEALTVQLNKSNAFTNLAAVVHYAHHNAYILGHQTTGYQSQIQTVFHLSGTDYLANVSYQYDPQTGFTGTVDTTPSNTQDAPQIEFSLALRT